MKSGNYPFQFSTRLWRLLMVVSSLGLCAGCAVPVTTVNSEDKPSQPVVSVLPVNALSHKSQTVRYSRYTLVESAPRIGLLEQPVDITIPLSVNGEATTVLDALRYVLMRSGYQLCDSSEAIEVFRAWILPAAHVHLGPMSLRQVLETMAGRAWRLRINEQTRVICFDAAISNGSKEDHDE